MNENFKYRKQIFIVDILMALHASSSSSSYLTSSAWAFALRLNDM